MKNPWNLSINTLIYFYLFAGIDNMTEKSAPDEGHQQPTLKELASSAGTHNVQPTNEIQNPDEEEEEVEEEEEDESERMSDRPTLNKAHSMVSKNEFFQPLHSLSLSLSISHNLSCSFVVLFFLSFFFSYLRFISV